MSTSTPQPGERRIFRYIPIRQTDPGNPYAIHNGQVVTVCREFCISSNIPRELYYVDAADGWRGAVFTDELEEIAA
jgi:hypothetical protein